MNLANLARWLVAVLVLTSCAPMSLSPQDRRGLQRVSIAPIELPDRPFVLSPGSGVGLLIAGPIGFALANGTSDLPTAYKAMLAEKGIDIAGGIRAEFQEQFSRKRIEVVAEDGDADARLSIEVMKYGLTGELFDNNRFPQLVANLKLVNRKGEVIWRQTIAAHISQAVAKQVRARPVADYFNDTAMLESQIRRVNQILIAAALKEF